jgi:outer membrane protein TolC
MLRARLPVLHLLIASFALIVTVGGCASSRGITPQDRPMAADQLAAGRSLVMFSNAAFPSQDWWKALGDPQLDALIGEALAGTPTLDAADARVRQAVAQAGLAESARKPSLGVGAQYAGIRIPVTVAPAPLGGNYKGIVLLNLAFKYDPDFWGGKRAKWEAALGQARATEVDAQAARLLLASNIASTYVVLAQAHAAHDVAVAEQARASHLLNLGRQRVKAGIDTTRNALAALLGKGPDRGLDITRPTLLAAPSPGVPAVLPSELLGHRPDVVAARWRVEAAQHGIQASKVAFYPTVNLAGMVGLASSGLSNLFGSNSLLLQGGPAISLPIFDGGGLRNQLAKSNADYDLAVSSYNQTLVVALREVADALQSARSLDAQIASARQAGDSAQAAWQLAQTRYRAGLGTQLDVLAAQQPLLQLDQRLAALHAQRLNAAIDLDRALGGGLTFVAPNSSALNSTPDLAKTPTP